jgi:hypothetical protein
MDARPCETKAEFAGRFGRWCSDALVPGGAGGHGVEFGPADRLADAPFQLATPVPPDERVRRNAKRSTGGSSYATLIDFTPNEP